MSDSTLNRFLGEGDDAQEAAFTPDPPTPASGPDSACVFVNKENPAVPILKWWDGANFQPLTGGGTGTVVQVVNTQTGAVATGTTIVPLDDTIPQNTEGDEYMTLAITPTDAAHLIRIDVVGHFAFTVANSWLAVALFQDSTADALAVGFDVVSSISGNCEVSFTHWMTAGTTSATTFKVRAGANGAGTTTFNGRIGARLYGGVIASSITITEYVP